MQLHLCAAVRWRFVHSVVRRQTCEPDTLTTNEPSLVKINTSGLRNKDMKWSACVGQEVKG